MTSYGRESKQRQLEAKIPQRHRSASTASHIFSDVSPGFPELCSSNFGWLPKYSCQTRFAPTIGSDAISRGDWLGVPVRQCLMPNTTAGSRRGLPGRLSFTYPLVKHEKFHAALVPRLLVHLNLCQMDPVDCAAVPNSWFALLR